MMTFKSVDINFAGYLLIISFYLILSWDIKSICCADFIAPIQVKPGGVYHYSISNTTNPRMKQSNHSSFPPKNVEKSMILQTITVLVGVIAILILINRCIQFIKANDRIYIQKSIRRLSTDDKGDKACQSAAENPDGAAAPPSEETDVATSELEVQKAIILAEMINLCQALAIEEGTTEDKLKEMAPEHANDWLDATIEMAEREVDKHYYASTLSEQAVLDLVNERNVLLKKLKEIKQVANPTVFLATTVLFERAMALMEAEFQIKMDVLRSLLDSLTGDNVVETQTDVNYVAPLEPLMESETGEKVEKGKAFIKACKMVIPALIQVNNLKFAHIQRVRLLMDRITLSDEELLASRQQKPAE